MSDSDAMPYVYIIYFPEDQELVDRLIIQLSDWGLPAKITPPGLHYGSPAWVQAAETGIEAASAVLVLGSSDSNSAAVAVELIQFAERYKRPVHEVHAVSTTTFEADLRLSLASEKPSTIIADRYSVLFNQIIGIFGFKSAVPIENPEPEFDSAGEDRISAKSTAALDEFVFPAVNRLTPAAPIPPPYTTPSEPNLRPRPSSGVPVAAAAPGSTAGPSDNFGRQSGGGGSGAAARDSNRSRENARRKSVDAPAAVAPASKKSESVVADDSKQAETEAPEAGEAVPAVEAVHFTAFRPEMVPVGQWLTLLVYAHADRARDLIAADADKFSDHMGGKPRAVLGKAAAPLARGTELRIVPTCDGVQFNPESISFKWIEDWHRAEFRFQAESALSGTEDVARVAIYVGPLLVGQIKLALTFNATQTMPAPNILSAITGRGKVKSRGKLKPTSTKMYEAQQIFLSYSHADTNIVLACRDACKRLGFIPLIDVDTLRAGQHWNEELMNMIERADIFQLFWSERAAQSKYVQQEWEYALQLVQKKSKGPDFIRPTYWEKPPAPIPEPLAAIHFDYTPAVS